MYEGATITSNKNGITNISFSKSDFSLANFETNTITQKKTQEISSTKLLNCINYFYKFKKKDFEKIVKNIKNCTYSNKQNIIKEFYKRFIIPFYIPLLSLIPFLLITSSKENPNYNKLRITTFLIGLLVIIFSETTIRFVSEISILDIAVMLIPLFLLLSFYIFLFSKFNINFKN